ncbi:MAG: hypothetical protein LBV23_09675 [Deltaproteobacteria bacterium]|jgi:tRNA1(Val) A37 N6-methylase TrmN6|nr:hypothetical protein [Deltaproteobacteria bacterium]
MGPDAKDDYLQPPKGVRFSADSILLAHRLPLVLKGRAADFGSGCGVVGLEALRLGRLKGLETLFFIEVNRDLYFDSLTVNINDWLKDSWLEKKRREEEEKIGDLFLQLRPVFSDWRYLKPEDLGGLLDYIAVNPPYFPLRSSGLSAKARQSARHEAFGSLNELIEAASRLIKPSALLTMTFPRLRLSELIKSAARHGFYPIRLHLPARAQARLVIIDFKKY